jgi:hypothetical protein
MQRRESDRAIVPLKPGNSGGGKGPDFSCALEDDETEVIGREAGKRSDCTCKAGQGNRVRRFDSRKRRIRPHRAGEGGRVGAFGMKACCEPVWH